MEYFGGFEQYNNRYKEYIVTGIVWLELILIVINYTHCYKVETIFKPRYYRYNLLCHIYFKFKSTRLCLRLNPPHKVKILVNPDWLTNTTLVYKKGLTTEWFNVYGALFVLLQTTLIRNLILIRLKEIYQQNSFIYSPFWRNYYDDLGLKSNNTTKQV